MDFFLLGFSLIVGLFAGWVLRGDFEDRRRGGQR